MKTPEHLTFSWSAPDPDTKPFDVEQMVLDTRREQFNTLMAIAKMRVEAAKLQAEALYGYKKPTFWR